LNCNYRDEEGDSGWIAFGGVTDETGSKGRRVY